MWSGYEIVNWTVNEWKVTNGREGKGKQNLGLMASSRSSLFVHSLTSVTFIPLTSGPWSTLFLRSFPIVHPPLGFASSPRSAHNGSLSIIKRTKRSEERGPSESRVKRTHVRSSHQPNGTFMSHRPVSITSRLVQGWLTPGLRTGPLLRLGSTTPEGSAVSLRSVHGLHVGTRLKLF